MLKKKKKEDDYFFWVECGLEEVWSWDRGNFPLDSCSAQETGHCMHAVNKKR